MIRIIDDRGTGKTSRLLLLAKETGGIVVCAAPLNTREKAHYYGLTGINFLSYIEYITNKDKIDKPIFIDDIEAFLKVYTENKLAGYTLSKE